MSMQGTTAMILAGGRSKRMEALCYERSKPVLPYAGMWRVIDFTLSNSLHSGIRKIGVLVDFLRQPTAEYLRDWRKTNSDAGTLHILEPQFNSYKGTADAVYQNLDFLDNSDLVLVLAGDHIYKMDFRKMLAFHLERKADVTLGVFHVPSSQASRFGIITVDNEDKIVDFVEKPHQPAGNLASMGIYLFNKDLLARYLVEDCRDPESLHDFGYSLIPGMIRNERVFAYRFNGYWRDIGTIDTYYEANMEVIRPRPALSLDSDWPILTLNNTLPTSAFSHGAIKQSLVSPGCVIRGKVDNSVLSPGVVVDDQAVVRNSIIMANTFIGRHSIVEHCILDEEVNVGKFCYVGFGSGITQGSNITVLGKAVSIPPGTAIGRSQKVLSETALLTAQGAIRI